MSLNVDLAVTEDDQVILYVEEPVPSRLKAIDFHAPDGRVSLSWEQARPPQQLLEHPVSEDLRRAFRVSRQAAIGHVTAEGTLTQEYLVPIIVRRSPARG